MKTINILLMLLLGSWSVTLAQSPIIGTWKGSYGNGSAQTGNFYSLQFNADGTMKVLYPDGNTICSGKHTITNNTVTGTYYYNGNQPYSFIGTYNPANNTITGTGGTGTATSGGFSWIMTSKSGGAAPAAAAVPFGSKSSTTKTAVTPTQTATSQPMQVVPKTGTGMMVTGVATIFSNPSYTRQLPDGTRVTTTMTANKAVNNSLQEQNLGSRSETSPDGIVCTTETKKITAESSNYNVTDYGNTIASIYPGAIYTFDDFMSGSRREIIAGRNPIRIGTTKTSGVSGDTYRDVSNPAGNTITNSIANLRNTFSTAGSNVSWRVYSSQSDAEYGLKISAAGGYAGFSASGNFSSSGKDSYYILTIEAEKTFFTVTSEVPLNGYFTDKAQEQQYKNPIVIKNVVYGCRVLANVIVRTSTSKEAIDAKAAYKGVGMNFEAACNYVKENNFVEKSVNAMIIGGPAESTIIPADNLYNEIMKLIASANQATAEPISYTLTDLSGAIIGIQTATDVFTTRLCTKNYKLKSVRAFVTTGRNDPKNDGSKVYFTLYNSQNITCAKSSGDNNIEFPLNSRTPFPLNVGAIDERFVKAPVVDLNKALTLNNLKSGSLVISFNPVNIALGFDEWQISRIEIHFEFVDDQGFPYPTNSSTGSPDPLKVVYDNLNVYMKRGWSTLTLPFNYDGAKFVAGGPSQGT